jgi:hypothetical protein
MAGGSVQSLFSEEGASVFGVIGCGLVGWPAPIMVKKLGERLFARRRFIGLSRQD